MQLSLIIIISYLIIIIIIILTQDDLCHNHMDNISLHKLINNNNNKDTADEIKLHYLLSVDILVS